MLFGGILQKFYPKNVSETYNLNLLDTKFLLRHYGNYTRSDVVDNFQFINTQQV